MIQHVQLEQFTCPGGYSQWVKVPLSATTVSVGFQNQAYAQNFWVSQMFISADGSYAFWQVINTSFTDTYWWPYLTIDSTDGFDRKQATADAKMQTQKISN